MHIYCDVRFFEWDTGFGFVFPSYHCKKTTTQFNRFIVKYHNCGYNSWRCQQFKLTLELTAAVTPSCLYVMWKVNISFLSPDSQLSISPAMSCKIIIVLKIINIQKKNPLQCIFSLPASKNCTSGVLSEYI